MASDTLNKQKQPSSNSHGVAGVPVQLPPELLMAAKCGDWRKLNDLMISNGGASAAPLPRQVTIDIEEEEADEQSKSYDVPDSALHVAASGGDGDEFLRSSTVIYGKAKHLLCTRNAMGDTPLHCAARAGSTKMVSHLIHLARQDDDGDGASRLLVALRKENKQGETALHEALRCSDEEMVRVLMSADRELARFPRNGVSPLYLAILLGHDDLAEKLYEMGNQLSYSGPDRQNALHVAVLKSERMTEKLLLWNKSLIKQGDRSSGSTLLHFAASRSSSIDTSGTAELLLNDDESSAYQPDGKGSFPIHVAARWGKLSVLRVLLQKRPHCAQLRDAQGRTFLHVAVLNRQSCRLVWWICSFQRGKRGDACQTKRFARNMNMHDNNGNTALHLAVEAGRVMNMYPFMWYKEVQLNLPNYEGHTALDLAGSMTPTGVFYVLDPRIRIHNMLKRAGGRAGVKEEVVPSFDVGKEAEKIKDSTPTIGVVSVLILTISAAAAFQLPGGYTTAGTPVLATRYSFQAFVVANYLGAFCSVMATVSLVYAGVTTVDIGTRVKAFIISIFFLNSSARALAGAFAFGTYALLAPVAHVAANATCLVVLFFLDIAWFTCTVAADQLVLLNRQGLRLSACLGLACSMVWVPFSALWPYVVIAGFIAYLKIHGIH